MEIKNWLTIRGQSANAVCLDRLAPINSLHREPLGDGKYRYLSGVATCVNDDRVREVLRLEAVE